MAEEVPGTDAERVKAALGQIERVMDPTTAQALESAFYAKKAAIAQSIAQDGTPNLSPSNSRDGLAETFVRGLLGPNPTAPLKLDNEKLDKLREPLAALGANIGLKPAEMDKIFQDLKTGAHDVADSYASRDGKLVEVDGKPVIRDSVQNNEGVTTLYNSAIKLATVVEDGVALGLVNRGTLGTAKAIDAIKTSNIDPKIKDAVADIASRTGMFGITIQESLEGEVNSRKAIAEGRTEAAKAAMVNRMPIGDALIVGGLLSSENTLNLMAGIGIPPRGAIDDESLARIKKPIADIVASQGLKPADVDGLLHQIQVGQEEMFSAQRARGDMRDALWAEGNKVYADAQGKLARAIKDGIDMSIQGTAMTASGTALQTPLAPDKNAPEKKQR
jgi:hypothetical protein